MGIVLKQSFTNTISLFLGFAIGGVNVLFLYTNFLSEDYYALITFLLSASMILQPLLTLGVQHTIIKFYSLYPSAKEKNQFLVSSLFVPLLAIIPLAVVGIISYEQISLWLSQKNKMIENYVWLIFVLAIFMGYFELFYAWSQVQLKSVFGHFIKEVFARICIFFLLFTVYF
ncbi:MAG: lipopolysaccharide biosynthesis protein, partial [Flavobacteriaceae bacterium]|nr:lipopolysaccharide biosynthesis protein [Flavobacteriaceae bacterium]